MTPLFIITSDESLGKWIKLFNACQTLELKAAVIHELIEEETHSDLAYLLQYQITSQSLNFQNYVNSITPNWEYVQTGRNAIKARQKKWSIRNILHTGKKWKSYLQKFLRSSKT